MDTQIGAAVPLYTEDTPEGSLFFCFMMRRDGLWLAFGRGIEFVRECECCFFLNIFLNDLNKIFNLFDNVFTAYCTDERIVTVAIVFNLKLIFQRFKKKQLVLISKI